MFNNVALTPNDPILTSTGERERDTSQPSLITPSPCFLAIGCYDGTVRLISLFTWQIVFDLPLAHPKELAPLGLVEEGLVTKVEVGSSEINATLGKTSLKESASLFEASIADDMAISLDAALSSPGAMSPANKKTNPIGSTTGKPSTTAATTSGSSTSLFVTRMVKHLPKSPVEIQRSLSKFPTL